MSAHNKAPIAVIGFSTAGSPLQPVWPSTHRALLPIVGKALIVHLIEKLASSGIRHVRIAGSIQQYAVRQRLGGGHEWGITIRYSDLHDADLRTQTLFEHGHCLYLCGDNLHIGDFSPIQATGAATPGDLAERSERPAYWHLGESGPTRYSIATTTGAAHIRHPILTVGSYHQANLDAAASDSGLMLPGRSLKPGVIVDWDSSLAADARLGDKVTIGKHCRLSRRVYLESQCVLSNGVVVDSNTQLRNVSVLPNTYIGKGTRLRDAVVTPTGVFDLDGHFFPSPDPSVIGRARGNAERQTGIPSENLSMLEMGLSRSA